MSLRNNPFRTNALNGTKPLSARVYTAYIKQLLENNPSIKESIDKKISGESKNTNITKLQKNAEDASKKVIELKEQLAKAEENAKQLSDRVSQLASSNNSIELPIQFVKTFSYGSMDPINLLKVSPLFKKIVDSTFIINDIDNFDTKWINECEIYINNLSLFDKITLLGYTYHGDEYINSYLRTHSINNNIILSLLKEDLKVIFDYKKTDTNIPIRGLPFYSQICKKYNITNIESYFYKQDTNNIPIGHITREGILKIKDILESKGINKNSSNNVLLNFFEQIIKEFGQDLDNIIKNAPKLSKNMKVFRGIKNDYIRENTLINGFTSTTISLYVATTRFSNYSNNNIHNTRSLYEIIVTSTTPCMFIPPKYTWPGKSGKTEFEVLIGSNVLANPSDIKFRCIFNPPLDKLLWAFINFRNCGEVFKTRIITFSSTNSTSKTGGKRKTYKNKKKYKSKKYTKKYRY